MTKEEILKAYNEDFSEKDLEKIKIMTNRLKKILDDSVFKDKNIITNN